MLVRVSEPKGFFGLLVVLAVLLSWALSGLAHGSGSTLAALERVPVHTSDRDEPQEDRRKRLAVIAEAIDSATANLDERAWLIVTAKRESGLAKRITEDHDYCRLGRGGACDGGRAYGTIQLHGVSRDLTQAEQFAEGIARLRRGANYCRARGFDHWLGGTSQYATGRTAERGGCSWVGAKERVQDMWRVRAGL